MVIKNNFHNQSQGQTLIIGIIVVLVAVGLIVGGLYFYLQSRMPKGIEVAEEPSEEEEASEEEPSKPAGPIDCGTDFDCLIEASKNCSPATLTFTMPLGIFGMIITTTTFYEIKGMEENKCVLYLRTEEQNIRFSDEMVQQMLTAGATQEQIRQQEQESNKIADELIEGLDGICRFDSADDLASLLNKFKGGTFSGEVSCKLREGEWKCISTGDWDVAECEGEMFKSQTGETFEEEECIFSEDCKEGFHCFKRRCISNNVLKDASKCSPTVECTESCVGCKKETYSCMFSSEEFKNQLCVECFTDLQCKSGYICEEYKCVKE